MSDLAKIIRTFIGSGYGDDIVFTYENDKTVVTISDGFSVMQVLKSAPAPHKNILVNYLDIKDKIKHKKKLEMNVVDDKLVIKSKNDETVIDGTEVSGLTFYTSSSRFYKLNIKPFIESFKLASSIAYLPPDESFNVQILNNTLTIHNHVLDVTVTMDTNYEQMNGMYNYFTLSHIVKTLELMSAYDIQVSKLTDELYIEGPNFVISTPRRKLEDIHILAKGTDITLATFVFPEEFHLYVKNDKLYVNDIPILTDYFGSAMLILDKRRTTKLAGKTCTAKIEHNSRIKFEIENITLYPKYQRRFEDEVIWQAESNKTGFSEDDEQQ